MNKVIHCPYFALLMADDPFVVSINEHENRVQLQLVFQPFPVHEKSTSSGAPVIENPHVYPVEMLNPTDQNELCLLMLRIMVFKNFPSLLLHYQMLLLIHTKLYRVPAAAH